MIWIRQSLSFITDHKKLFRVSYWLRPENWVSMDMSGGGPGRDLRCPHVNGSTSAFKASGQVARLILRARLPLPRASLTAHLSRLFSFLHWAEDGRRCWQKAKGQLCSVRWGPEGKERTGAPDLASLCPFFSSRVWVLLWRAFRPGPFWRERSQEKHTDHLRQRKTSMSVMVWIDVGDRETSEERQSFLWQGCCLSLISMDLLSDSGVFSTG